MHTMMNASKYTRQYFMPPEESNEWVKKDYIDHAPMWCSVDLRDGNQSLVVPMALHQKLAYFKMLTEIGFKEIEVGFPAASDTEYTFLRTLIEQDLIPDHVTVQVLTQAREHIIRKTFEAVRGAKHAIIHIYNSVSKAQREQVFGMSRQEVMQIATDGAEMIKQLAGEEGADYRFEYSPESFTGTEPAYALEVCNAVLDIWKPTPDRKVIINLPSTVQLSLPHVFAGQVEYMHRHLAYRDNVILSLHPHNDRGSGVSDAELGMLAGAQRIEGTLFGNGERTGNVDVVTLAMNLYAHGIDPGLDFKNMRDICERFEKYTGMPINERSPYCGALVFAAFSGSHQDAIAKAMEYREKNKPDTWSVPYLLIDPADIGKSRDANVIRINSQSGKGGVGYILEHHYGLRLPKKFRETVGYAAKHSSDETHRELPPDELYELFKREFVGKKDPIAITGVHFRQHNGIIAEVTTVRDGRRNVILASGNGRLNAVSNALQKYYGLDYHIITYEEHSLDAGSNSDAIAYVGIQDQKHGDIFWGAGVDEDIIKASIDALVTAVNHLVTSQPVTST